MADGFYPSIGVSDEPQTYTITYSCTRLSAPASTNVSVLTASELPEISDNETKVVSYYYDDEYTQKAEIGDVLTSDVTLYALEEDVRINISLTSSSVTLATEGTYCDRDIKITIAGDIANTSDADATSTRILAGAIAYVQGEKVTGTIPTYTGEAASPVTTLTFNGTQVTAVTYNDENVNKVRVIY